MKQTPRAASFASAVAVIALAVSGTVVSTQAAKLGAGDTATGDAFGLAVAVAATTAVAGAQSHAGHGAVYVFTKSASSWHEQAELKGSDTAAGDSFGSSVAVSGSTIVVGAPNHHSGRTTGAAYIFTRTGTKWTQQFEDRASNAGEAAAIDGTTVAIGSAKSAGTGIGSVDIFVRSGTSWTHQVILKSGVVNDGFGNAISLSGNELAVAANAGGSVIGHVYVYGRAGKTWHRQATLTGGDTASTDDFAQSVAISGTTVIAGAPLHANGDGAAYVFVKGAHGWSQQARLTESSPIAGDMFGWAVGISGSEAIAGAYQRGGTGAAFTFLRSGTVWSHDKTEHATGSVIGDEVGWSVAQSASTSVVGAPSASNGAGTAYIFLG